MQGGTTLHHSNSYVRSLPPHTRLLYDRRRCGHRTFAASNLEWEALSVQPCTGDEELAEHFITRRAPFRCVALHVCPGASRPGATATHEAACALLYQSHTTTANVLARDRVRAHETLILKSYAPPLQLPLGVAFCYCSQPCAPGHYHAQIYLVLNRDVRVGQCYDCARLSAPYVMMCARIYPQREL